jgi:cyclin-dependent kinase 7
MDTLPDYIQMKPMAGMPLRQVFTAAGDDVLDLIMATLAYDPHMRMQADAVGVRMRIL